jgi:DNA-directed RNA polymerase subunit L
MIDREKVARAIYDAEDPNSGDAIATTIHTTEHIPPHGTLAEQLEQVMDTCRSAADAAIAAVLEQLREPTKAMLDAGAETPGMKAVGSLMEMQQARGYRFSAGVFDDGAPLTQAFRAMLEAAKP